MRILKHTSLLLLAVLVSAPTLLCAQALSEDARRADLAQFRSEFFARDASYAPNARAQAEARLAQLERDIATASTDATRFALELAQIAALADNGHTLSFAGPRLARSNRVAIRLVPLSDQFFVVRTRQVDADLLGARLLAIDDLPMQRLRELAHSLTGGLPAWRDRNTPLFLESPQQLHALGASTASDGARYRFESAGGAIIERRLLAEPPDAQRPRADTQRLLLPEVGTGVSDWVGLLPLAQAPWSLRDAEKRFRWRHDAELNALVVDLRLTTNTQTQKIADFIGAVNIALQELKPRNLVLDLRQNGGGDLTRARDFAQSLPAAVPGRLFVLTSPWTFSAAISTAAYLKQAAPTRVSIVGEAVGDRPHFFAEGRPITLKHSGEVLLMATERHDYVEGCRTFTDCHAPVRQRPISVPSLAPDIAAPWTLHAYRAGIDPAMLAVAQALRASK